MKARETKSQQSQSKRKIGVKRLKVINTVDSVKQKLQLSVVSLFDGSHWFFHGFSLHCN